MQYIFALIGFCALVGAFSLGFKAANMLRERRKSRAFQYLRDAGAYPPIYTGYGPQQQQPQPDTQHATQTRNSGATDRVGGVLYICIVLTFLYACVIGLT